ncbi:MAG TPA: RNA methyltransferase [Leptospiraceae bacterium]|nr:RNA methyltransferase [Leptospiraceae bacterium]HNH08471.1 RNA methyltransferase [Leptospiraceae bacterium]
MKIIKARASSVLPDLNSAVPFEGRTYSIPYLNIGDEVEFEPKRGWNRVISVESAEPDISRCRYFRKCGGCKAQHLEYAEQFRIKTAPHTEYYIRNFDVSPILVPAEVQYRYRNRMDFAVFPEKIGLRQEGNFRNIIDVSSCELQSEEADRILSECRNIVPAGLAYDRKKETGFLKYITLRTDSDRKETMTVFTFTEDFRDTYEEKLFREKAASISSDSVIFCFNRKKSEVSADGEYSVIKGRSLFTENILGKNADIPFNSFFQPNLKGFYPILSFIEKELLNIEDRKMMADFFCGTGLFSIVFAEYFETAVGFDISADSVRLAEQNVIKIYPEKKILFRQMDLFSIREKINSFADISGSAVFLDPPRAGIGTSMADLLLDLKPKHIFYISCNPYSQETDLEILKTSYRLKSILITDPYPNTPHLESVAFLERL